MAGSRSLMLDRIRKAVAAGASAEPSTAVPRGYQRNGTQPAGSAPVIELLVDRLVDYKAQVTLVDSDTEVAAAVHAALGSAASVVVPEGLDVNARTGAATGRQLVIDGAPATLRAGELDAIDAVVTGATVAIAVTGTIILSGSPHEGRRVISLVPDLLVVLLRAEQIVQTVPEGIAALTPTAPMTMISGPSATSDIELSRVEGVHGPRTLHVVIVR